MTENKTKKELERHIQFLRENWKRHPDYNVIEAIKESIQALEEIQEYREIGTVEELKNLKLKEHNYDNCHNYTCRKKCEKDGYAKAIDEFTEKFIFKAVCEGCSGCCDCYENETQNTCEDWKYYMEIVEQMKGGAE